MRHFDSYEHVHPEWQKPPFPYVVGAKIEVHPHQPPSPPVPPLPIVYDDMDEREEFSPLSRCLKHPPPPGEEGEGTLVLEIMELVAAADGTRSQLALVGVEPRKGAEHDGDDETSSQPLPADVNLVAKFYDPLYFDHQQDDGDAFKSLNSGYSYETEAYSRLSSLQGTAIPKYYGSYTTSFAVPAVEENGTEQQRRHVRLILMEFIPGKSMQQANPQDYPQEQRQAIISSILDAETVIYANNIVLLDLYPRNIILKQQQEAKGTGPATRSRTQSVFQLQKQAVVLLDFEIVHLDRHDPYFIKRFGRETFMPGVVISPLLRWIGKEKGENFGDWVDWDWQGWIEERYGKDRVSITDQMKEVWGPDDA